MSQLSAVQKKRKQQLEDAGSDPKQQKLSFKIPTLAAREAGAKLKITTTTTTTTVEVDFSESVEQKKKAVQEEEKEQRKKEKQGRFTVAGYRETTTPKPKHVSRFQDHFDHILDGVGDECFFYTQRGSPLASKGAKLRGSIAEDVVKQLYEKRGHVVVKPEKTNLKDGRARSERSQGNDFDVVVPAGDEGERRKYEVKQSRMCFERSRNRWILRFANVKKDEFHTLILVVEAFDGMHVYEWGGKNYRTSGVRESTQGGSVSVIGRAGETDPDSALSHILSEMRERNEFISFVPFADKEYAPVFALTTKGESIYEDSPLCDVHASARGAAVENVVKFLLQEEEGRCVEPAPDSQCVNGVSRGKGKTECDWLTDGKRTESKSSLMTWHTIFHCYTLNFEGVKYSLHDKLFLSFFTPRGIHIFEHFGGEKYEDERTDSLSESALVQCKETTLAFNSHRGWSVPTSAETWLLKHFKWKGYKYLAFVKFEEGDKERLSELVKTIGELPFPSGAGEEEEEDEEEEESED